MKPQRIIVFGSTGRVGGHFLQYALQAGRHVTAFARNPAKITKRHANLMTVQGDTLDPESVRRALEPGFDAVVMVVGVDPLKPSTVVQDSVRTIFEAMTAAGISRYLGISGTAQMPATPLGAVTQFFIRRAIAAASDHQRAFELVAGSKLDHALVACPYIKDGTLTRRYHLEPGRFPGGYKTISPEDVANFLAREGGESRYHRQTVAIWFGRRHGRGRRQPRGRGFHRRGARAAARAAGRAGLFGERHGACATSGARGSASANASAGVGHCLP